MHNHKFHTFKKSISGIGLPRKFTFPFNYKPHPLCILAANEVNDFLTQQNEWQTALSEGKMFGVLIVKNTNNKIGYLVAFSGNLLGTNQHDFFVPPVYDMLQPNDFFRKEESYISGLNKKIEILENNPIYLRNQENVSKQQAIMLKALQTAKTELKISKAKREEKRQNGISETEYTQLIAESQFQNATYKRLEKYHKEALKNLQGLVLVHQAKIESLKQERKKRSGLLQQKIFEQFIFLNAKNETKNLCEIFAETVLKIPPAGAGECAAPKLLQYAYLNNLQPLAMAEFWYGNSPKNEIRKHGNFYPACKGKCEPILQHTLQGLQVDENPLEKEKSLFSLEILYEDDSLFAINKPTGILSVKGKTKTISIEKLIKEKFPYLQQAFMVHRLDMDTSGVLLIAKTAEMHTKLQKMFANRQIKKKYIALLAGEIKQTKGVINLPLYGNPLERPRQSVNFENGKNAITEFEVISYQQKYTRIAFFPITGRTHQLRVHAAHKLGLNCPIVGDNLYGTTSKRLCLHAASIKFTHPTSGKEIIIDSTIPF